MPTDDDVEDAILGQLDAFDRFRVRGEQNDADISSDYPASPERHRLYVDGTRQFIQYASDPTNPTGIPYQHDVDVHRLSPAAGETVTFYTAERFRYVVQFVKAVSWAIEASRDLESNEYVVVGAFEGTPGAVDPGDSSSTTDGWLLKYTSEIAADGSQADAIVVRDGTVKDTTQVSFQKGLQTWSRYLLNYNWYNVGPGEFTETYTSDGEQQNVPRGSVSVDDDRGPRTGNLRVGVEVKAASSGLEVLWGSVGSVTQGDVNAILRPKGAEFKDLAHSGGGNWEPLLALRKDPSRSEIAARMTGVEALSTPGTEDALLVVSVDPSKTDANFDDPEDTGTNSSPSAPPEHNKANSVVEYTEAVSTMPDDTGTASTAVSNPGGYQLAHDAARSSSPNEPPESMGNERKRPLGSDGDVAIVAGRSGTADNFDVLLNIEQDW